MATKKEPKFDKPMVTESNIFEKGMLINLNIGGYAGRQKLRKEDMKDLPTEIVRAVFDLFDNDFTNMLRSIALHDGETRGRLKEKCVPFPIKGVYFLSSHRITEAFEFLEKRKAERKELIDKVVDEYEAAIDNYKGKYPEYYEKAKRRYLSVDSLKYRFYFEYQLLEVSSPNKATKFISPEMYKAEMNKFKGMIDEMKDQVVSVIHTELLTMASRLKKQCVEENGKPNQRTFNSLNEFLQRIDDVYSEFVDRKDLKAIIKQIKAQVLDVSADQLRDSDDFKKEFGKKIGEIAQEIKALPDIKLSRAIEF